MPARDGTRGSPRSKVEDNRDAGRDTLFHREVPRNSPLTPTLSGSTELADVHPKRKGRGERAGRDARSVQGRRSEARNLDPWTLDRGTLDQRRDGTGCFIEKSSTNVCGGKKLADGSGHFVSLGTGPTLSSPRSKVTESPGGRSSLRSRSTRRRTGTGHDVLSRKASE
jgi:hypothetical protein